jgi:hypothetical protein
LARLTITANLSKANHRNILEWAVAMSGMRNYCGTGSNNHEKKKKREINNFDPFDRKIKLKCTLELKLADLRIYTTPEITTSCCARHQSLQNFSAGTQLAQQKSNEPKTALWGTDTILPKATERKRNKKKKNKRGKKSALQVPLDCKHECLIATCFPTLLKKSPTVIRPLVSFCHQILV